MQLRPQNENQRPRRCYRQAGHAPPGHGSVQKYGRQNESEDRSGRCYHTGIRRRRVLHAQHIAELVDSHAAERHQHQRKPVPALNMLPGNKRRNQPEQQGRTAQAETRHAHSCHQAALHGPLAKRTHETETHKGPQGQKVSANIRVLRQHTECLHSPASHTAHLRFTINVPFCTFRPRSAALGVGSTR